MLALPGLIVRLIALPLGYGLRAKGWIKAWAVLFAANIALATYVFVELNSRLPAVDPLANGGWVAALFLFCLPFGTGLLAGAGLAWLKARR